VLSLTCKLARSGECGYIDSNALLLVSDIVLLVPYIFGQEGGAMENRRIQLSDRRQNKELHKVSFIDCNGDPVTGNRREISNRRLDVIDLIPLLDDDIDLNYFDEFMIRSA
jgi:hypothetical protein